MTYLNNFSIIKEYLNLIAILISIIKGLLDYSFIF